MISTLEINLQYAQIKSDDGDDDNKSLTSIMMQKYLKKCHRGAENGSTVLFISMNFILFSVCYHSTLVFLIYMNIIQNLLGLRQSISNPCEYSRTTLPSFPRCSSVRFPTCLNIFVVPIDTSTSGTPTTPHRR